MNDDAVDELIRDRLREIVHDEVPDVVAPGSQAIAAPHSRSALNVAVVVGLSLVAIAGLGLLWRNDHRTQQTRTVGAPSTTVGSRAVTSLPTTRGLANFPLATRWSPALVATPDGFIVWGGSRDANNMGSPVTGTGPDIAQYSDGARYLASDQTWTMIPAGPISTGLKVAGSSPSLAVWSAGTLYVSRGTQAAAWDSATRQWRQLPSLSKPVEALAAVKGEVIAIGPDVALKTPAATTWFPILGRYTTVPHLGLEAVVHGDTVYVVPSTAVYSSSTPIVAYSATDRTWMDLPTSPIDSTVLTGGWDGSGLVVVNAAGHAARYLPRSNAWTALADLPKPMTISQSRWLAGSATHFMAFSHAGSATLAGNSWVSETSPKGAVGAVESNGAIYVLTLDSKGNSAVAR